MDRQYGRTLDVGKLLKAEDAFDAQNKQATEAPKQEPKKEMPIFAQKYILHIFVILLILASIFVLSQPAFLNDLEFKVKDSLIVNFKNSESLKIDKENPGVSPNQKAYLLNSKLNEVVQSAEFNQQVKTLAESYKNFYRDDKGQTYLYSTDPYYYFRLARNVVESKRLGDAFDSKQSSGKDSLRFFPFGDFPGVNIFPYVLAYFFKLSQFISPQISLLASTFYFPVFAGILSVLIFFLIARKLTNDFGGFIAALLFLIHPIFLFWNYAGYTDTQVLAQLWSLASILLFLYMIDFSNKIRALLCLIALFVLVYFYKFVWEGLFFIPILFVIFLAALAGIYIIHSTIIDKKKHYFLVLLLVIFSTVIISYYLGDIYWGRALAFIGESKVQTLFPSAFSSITELEGAKTFSRFSTALGGYGLLFLFLIELFFVLKSFKNSVDKYALFVFIWFFLMLVPAFKSTRFLFFVLPPFALIVGRCFFRLASLAQNFFKSILKLRVSDFSAKIAGLILICIVIVFVVNSNPFESKTKLPMATKSIVDAAEFIKLNSGQNAVIATAWDAGYAWQFFSKRATFFDGGLFNTERLYWISKVLSANNENVSVNSLKILSCGNDYLDVKALLINLAPNPQKISLFDQFLGSNDKAIASTLNISQSDVYCNKTNEVFVVVTEDMVYQTALFNHYSNWDFKKAAIRNSINGLSQESAVNLLTSKYNLSQDLALLEYLDAQSFTDVVSPVHIDRISDCTQNSDKIFCDNGFVIDTKFFNATYKGVHPKSLVFIRDQNKVVINYDDSPVNFSIVIYSSKGNFRSILMDADITQKTVMRMFIGEKLDNFDLVFTSQETPQRVVVYKLKE